VIDDLYRAQLEFSARDQLRIYDFSPTIRASTDLQQLANARDSRSLIPVLGAGASYLSGIPRWRALVVSALQRSVSDTAIPAHITTTLDNLDRSLTAQVRFVESSLGVRAAFRSHLFDCLYENYDPSFNRNPTLSATVAFILNPSGSRREALHDVITYNFDNLIELAIAARQTHRRSPLLVRPVYSFSEYEDGGLPREVRVYHPHGFIPHASTFSESLDVPIVFSETDYHEHYLDYNYWANQLQLAAFDRHTCLFIGLSLTDPNLRRLLDVSHKRRSTTHRHFAVFRVLPSSAGTSPPYLREYAIDTDLRSLGIAPIWVSDFAEIPALLD
jgi:hypothetical protein